MTNDDKDRIVSNEVAFRLHMIEQTAEIRGGLDTFGEKVKDLETCVYGPDGASGVVKRVHDAQADIKTLQTTVGKRETGKMIVQGLLIVVMGILAALGIKKP